MMSETADSWTVDVLGDPYRTLMLPLPDDEEGERCATLVHRPADGSASRGAVFHLHGFADYFFQTEFADWWAARGYDFYAVDLPKYGRSLRAHHTPNFTTDLADYFPILDEVWDRLIGAHGRIVASAHSTGGLTMPLWADDRRPDGLAGMVLNSPWLDLQVPAAARILGTPVLDRLGRWQPKRPIPRTVSGLYTRSLHKDHDGEWDFDLEWKPVDSFAVYAGWLRAIRRGHARVHAGLDVDCPVLVLSSGASGAATEMTETVHGTDVVLDVAQIRRWATAIGRHVTYAAVDGARHDVVLSRKPVRERAYAELSRWLGAYVDPV